MKILGHFLNRISYYSLTWNILDGKIIWIGKHFARKINIIEKSRAIWIPVTFDYLASTSLSHWLRCISSLTHSYFNSHSHDSSSTHTPHVCRETPARRERNVLTGVMERAPLPHNKHYKVLQQIWYNVVPYNVNTHTHTQTRVQGKAQGSFTLDESDIFSWRCLSLSLLNANIKLDSLWTHLEGMSLSFSFWSLSAMWNWNCHDRWFDTTCQNLEIQILWMTSVLVPFNYFEQSNRSSWHIICRSQTK